MYPTTPDKIHKFQCLIKLLRENSTVSTSNVLFGNEEF